MTPERIAELESLALAASKGKWETGRARKHDGKPWQIAVAVPAEQKPDGKVLILAKFGKENGKYHEQSVADSEFFAESRDGILELIHKVRTQEREINRLIDALDDVRHAVAGFPL